MADDMIILTRTFDLLNWLLPKGERFSKSTATRPGPPYVHFAENLISETKASILREAKSSEYIPALIRHSRADPF